MDLKKGQGHSASFFRQSIQIQKIENLIKDIGSYLKKEKKLKKQFPNLDGFVKTLILESASEDLEVYEDLDENDRKKEQEKNFSRLAKLLNFSLENFQQNMDFFKNEKNAAFYKSIKNKIKTETNKFASNLFAEMKEFREKEAEEILEAVQKNSSLFDMDQLKSLLKKKELTLEDIKKKPFLFSNKIKKKMASETGISETILIPQFYYA